MGIEPTPSAWKAEVLPLNYTRLYPPVVQPPLLDIYAVTLGYGYNMYKKWWRGVDSNHRRLSRQIYSLIPLATREPLPKSKRRSLSEIRPYVNSLRDLGIKTPAPAHYSNRNNYIVHLTAWRTANTSR